MIFHTKLKLPLAEIKIDHKSPIILTGSCFSTHIGQKLTTNKFKTLVNPYGILYHPHPILENLKNALEGVPPSPKGYLTHSEQHFHYAYHSDIRAGSRSELDKLIERIHSQVRNAIAHSTFMIVTLGSAFYYYHTDIQEVVSNCHKQPSTQFERKLSSPVELNDLLNKLIQLVHHQNKHLHIIFTVSPVRHLRDGLIANSRSKALLLSAVHELVDQHKFVSYFPAYELLIDDLRDYRFYEADLIHPNQQAIDYIWGYFKEAYMRDETKNLLVRIDHLLKAINHIPFNPESAAHQTFLQKTLNEVHQLSETHDIDMTSEIDQLSRQIKPT